MRRHNKGFSNYRMNLAGDLVWVNGRAALGCTNCKGLGIVRIVLSATHTNDYVCYCRIPTNLTGEPVLATDEDMYYRADGVTNISTHNPAQWGLKVELTEEEELAEEETARHLHEVHSQFAEVVTSAPTWGKPVCDKKTCEGHTKQPEGVTAKCYYCGRPILRFQGTYECNQG